MGNEKFLSVNHRDINAQEGSEDAQGYLKEFSESDIKMGNKSSSIPNVFGADSMSSENVVESRAEEDAEGEAENKEID